ncbi:hypothetical protein BH10BAC5_BH10BAC5_19450 [soil metagenome]
MNKRFELLILRPLQFVFIVAIFIFVFNKMWILLGMAVFCIFYLGVIGSKLHPYQSTTDLMKGPLESEAAKAETNHILPTEARFLIGHACTKVGFLIGLVTGITLGVATDMAWYFIVIIIFLTIMMVGGFLKFFFKTI